MPSHAQISSRSVTDSTLGGSSTARFFVASIVLGEAIASILPEEFHTPAAERYSIINSSRAANQPSKKGQGELSRIS